jgi:hypothetical protein
MKTMMTSMLVGAALLAACATPYGYSQLSGQRYHRAPIDTYPVVISQVDGKSPMLSGPAQVEPGLRKLVVQGPATATSRYGQTREFALDVKSCTRYYLVAQKANALSNAFEVKVDHEEPIGGCTPPTVTAKP